MPSWTQNRKGLIIANVCFFLESRRNRRGRAGWDGATHSTDALKSSERLSATSDLTSLVSDFRGRVYATQATTPQAHSIVVKLSVTLDVRYLPGLVSEVKKDRKRL